MNNIKRLLIVDDSNVIRNQISRYTAEMGFEIIGTASNPEQALHIYNKEKPDIVTMDLTMEGLTNHNVDLGGLDCIQAIIEIDPKARILVVSALEDKSTGLKAISYGAMGFINKPFKDQDLINALNDVINFKY